MASELLVVTVDLGSNQKDTITIREGDSLQQLAQSFSAKHKLNPFVQASIQTYLEQSLAATKPKDASENLKTGRKRREHPCVRLYKSGINQLKKREQQRLREQEAKVQSELEQMTFKPHINRAPSQSTRNLRREHPKHDHWPNVLDQCSFHPLLCEKSRRLAATKKELSITRPIETCSTKPDTVRSTRRINLSESVERLSRPAPRKGYAAQVLLRSAFTPKTGRFPRKERPSDVFTHLYESRSRSSSRSPKASRRVSANSRSSKLVEKLKANQFQSLFASFNPVHGLISHSTVTQSSVDGDVRMLLRPILDELQESGEQLTFEEFCGALDALYKQLSPEEKHQFLFKLKPSTHHSSTVSAKKISDLYQRLLTYKQSIEEQIQMVEEFDPTLKQFNRLK